VNTVVITRDRILFDFSELISHNGTQYDDQEWGAVLADQNSSAPVSTKAAG
jgi:hypothetical protein